MTVLLDARADRHKYTFRSVVDAVAGRKRGVLATLIRQSEDGIGVSRIWVDEACVGNDLKSPFTGFSEDVKRVFRTGRAECIQIEGKDEAEDFEEKRPKAFEPEGGSRFEPRVTGTRLFIEPISPRFHLIIAGAGHVGKAVSHLARLLDFEVSVIDDRAEHANPSNLPDAHQIVVGDIASQLTDIPLTQESFVVIVTRGHRCDAEALRTVVRSGAGYIGLMGSVTKVALMRKHFIEKEWCTAEEFDRVHTPIGLEIDSKTVQEIAVSIAAQLVQIRNTIRGKGEK